MCQESWSRSSFCTALNGPIFITRAGFIGRIDNSLLHTCALSLLRVRLHGSLSLSNVCTWILVKITDSKYNNKNNGENVVTRLQRTKLLHLIEQNVKIKVCDIISSTN